MARPDALLDAAGKAVPAPLWRRLAAMLYDSMLVIAIWMIVAYIVLAAFGIEQARTIEGDVVVLDPLYKNILFAAMLLSAFAFFATFWMKSGQTLGMQAWKIRVRNADDSPIALKQCLIRFVLAPFSLGALGLGYFWMLFDRERMTLHDRASRSEVVRVRL